MSMFALLDGAAIGVSCGALFGHLEGYMSARAQLTMMHGSVPPGEEMWVLERSHEMSWSGVKIGGPTGAVVGLVVW